MALALTPLHPLFAAQASGIDLSQPLSAADVRAIDAAMDQYAVLVWRDQPLSEDQQVAMAQTFGTLDSALKRLRGAPDRYRHEATIDISNVGADGQVIDRAHAKTASNIANQLWHSDASFQRPAAKYSMLHAVVCPAEGGDTEFCDLRAAYDALDTSTRHRIAGLQSEHYVLHSRMLLGDTHYNDAQKQMLPPVTWPLVRQHPAGRNVLWVGVHATHILGMTIPEGRMLLLDLLEHATQREFVYRHRWCVGDTVMWDNRATLHRGRYFDLSQRRELRRTTTEDPDSVAVA